MFKKYFMLLTLITMTYLVFGQSWNMGPFDLFTKKFGTNLEKVGTPVTYLAENDTVYTKLIPIGIVDGVYKVEFSAVKYDTASLNICVDVAFYNDRMAPLYRWSAWKRLFTTIDTEVHYDLTIDPADSTWWKPYGARQYRLYGATDSCTIYLSDFIK